MRSTPRICLTNCGTVENGAEHSLGGFAEFANPAVVNGKVYVATSSGAVVAYESLCTNGFQSTAPALRVALPGGPASSARPMPCRPTRVLGYHAITRACGRAISSFEGMAPSESSRNRATRVNTRYRCQSSVAILGEGGLVLSRVLFEFRGSPGCTRGGWSPGNNLNLRIFQPHLVPQGNCLPPQQQDSGLVGLSKGQTAWFSVLHPGIPALVAEFEQIHAAQPVTG
jgi:hypothetical protein